MTIHQSSWKECSLQLTVAYTSCLIAFLRRSKFIQHSVLKDLIANTGIPPPFAKIKTQRVFCQEFFFFFTEVNFVLEEKNENEPKFKFSIVPLLISPRSGLVKKRWAGDTCWLGVSQLKKTKLTIRRESYLYSLIFEEWILNYATLEFTLELTD